MEGTKGGEMRSCLLLYWAWFSSKHLRPVFESCRVWMQPFRHSWAEVWSRSISSFNKPVAVIKDKDLENVQG